MKGPETEARGQTGTDFRSDRDWYYRSKLEGWGPQECKGVGVGWGKQLNGTGAPKWERWAELWTWTCCAPASSRLDCAECIAETGQCVWCENTQTCLPFSDYVTRYIYGQCTSWVDTITMGHGCHNCSVHTQCDSCLSSFSCGWCGNDDNPTLGVCVDGDFTGRLQDLCVFLVLFLPSLCEVGMEICRQSYFTRLIDAWFHL